MRTIDFNCIPRPAALALASCAVLLAVGLAGCGESGDTVVIYVALDEMYSRPILDQFERETGIHVRAQYDTEAAKTTGLVNRLIAERDRPRADVFWNNEVVQTIRLKEEDLLVPYASPAASAYPPKYRDRDSVWTGFAARARVIIYNTDLVQEPPTSILDLVDSRWAGRAAIANPLFGTTASHAAALFALWGDDDAMEFFRNLKRNDIAVLPGNATVRDLVARGEYAWGLTDTDDANGGVEDGFPVAWLIPDQGYDEMGTLVIPNTVALIVGGPNPEAGRQLIDFLLRPEVEAQLSTSRSLQIPLNPAVQAPESVPRLSEIKSVTVSFAEAAGAMPRARRFIEQEFLE